MQKIRTTAVEKGQILVSSISTVISSHFPKLLNEFNKLSLLYIKIAITGNAITGL